MIITEPEGDNKDRSQLENPNPSQPLLSSSQSQPPPYSTAPNQPYIVHYPAVHHDDEVVFYRESPVKRFWKAFGVALLIWFLVAALTDSVAAAAQLQLRRQIKSWTRPLFDDRHESPDGTVHRCIATSDWTTTDHNDWKNGHTYWAETNISVPLESAFFLLSRGPYQHGHLDIEQSDSLAPGDRALVQIKASYHDISTLPLLSVCELHRGDDEYGVGFFTPTRPGRLRDDIRLDVKFILPASNRGKLLRVKGLETNLPHFTQEVADLADHVHFEKITLSSSAMPVKVKSVTTSMGSFVTTNAPVEGSFRSDGHLELATSNAHIRSSISLLNADDDLSTVLSISTNNGAIETDVALHTPPGLGGAFDVKAQTRNAPLVMTYTSSPIDSILRSTARTSNAPARMSLHAAFEGDFELESKHARPSVEQQSTTDPAGKGRHRHVSQNSQAGRLLGYTRWADASGGRKVERSKATVTTSNSPAQLVL